MANLLTKLCIISSIIGAVLLVIISDKLDIPDSDISSISKEEVNKNIKIKGFVKKVVSKGGIIVLDVGDSSSSIPVMIFKPDNLKISKGSFVVVDGKVSLYDNELQVIANSIKLVG